MKSQGGASARQGRQVGAATVRSGTAHSRQARHAPASQPDAQALAGNAPQCQRSAPTAHLLHRLQPAAQLAVLSLKVAAGADAASGPPSGAHVQRNSIHIILHVTIILHPAPNSAQEPEGRRSARKEVSTHRTGTAGSSFAVLLPQQTTGNASRQNRARGGTHRWAFEQRAHALPRLTLQGSSAGDSGVGVQTHRLPRVHSSKQEGSSVTELACC